MVAAVLDVLIVLAMTLSEPRRNRTGDMRATTDICRRYQRTCSDRPRTTTTISESNELRTASPSFLPTLDATIPKTANGTRATTQSSTFINNSKPIVSRSTTTLNEVSPFAFC
jgi:hypothetical protein